MNKLSNSRLDSLRNKHKREPEPWIKVGMSTCGISAGADKVFNFLTDEIKNRGLDIAVKKTGCNGLCYAEPIVEVNIPGVPVTVYRNVDEKLSLDIVEKHICNKTQIESIKHQIVDDKQIRVVLRNCGKIDPENIDDYIGSDGYQGLKKILSAGSQESVISELKESGLRGRGGGGFPTWMKWNFAKDVEEQEKYIICNADEGDPGAYMDRSVLEGDPHSVIEGMLVAGFATGANKGFFYIRAEYPLAIERVEKAIEQAKDYGLIAENILETGFNFDIR